MNTYFAYAAMTSTASDSNHEARIQEAIADLALQLKPNYLATAKRHKVNRITLARRHRGETAPISVANAETHQRLSIQQEEVLIRHINKLTDRGIPPTSRIVRNLAEEIINTSVGKNWTGQFVQRHKKQLKSLYLRNIDNLRTKAEYAPMFKHFYDLVGFFCTFSLPLYAIELTFMLTFIKLITGIEKYNITADNLYNWDEKGFLIGQASSTK